MSEIWTVINEALVILVVALISLLAWQARKLLNQKFTKEQLQILNWAAMMAVEAAEQYGGGAEEKKRQAVGLAQDWLTQHGIYIDLHTLDGAIEAAVFSEINSPAKGKIKQDAQ